MSNKFKSIGISNLTSTPTVIFTGTLNSTSTIIGLSLCNVTSSDITTTVLKDTFHLIKDVTIPSGSSLVVIGGDQKLVLENNSTITAYSSSSCDLVMSYLELT